jgi:acetate kinase
MADDVIITINTGSSSVKFGVYCREAAGARSIGKAVVDLQRRPIVLQIDNGEEVSEFELGAEMTNDQRDFVGDAVELLSTLQHFVDRRHRPSHGPRRR